MWGRLPARLSLPHCLRRATRILSRSPRGGRSFLPALLVLLLLTGSCQWFESKPESESQPLKAADLRALAARLRSAIASAGGSQVWIKPSAASGRAAGSSAPLQVLAAPGAYRAVMSALEQESARNKLEVRGVRAGRERSAGSIRSGVELNITRHGQSILRIHWREVPRILRAAIVIDDMGQDMESARRLLHLPYPLTYSVLPYLRYSESTAAGAHHARREVMLHLPMEPEPGAHPAPGEGEVRLGMSEAEVRRVVENDLSAVPFAGGVNNHMGSRATQSARLMASVMQVLAEHHVYFIDSRTTAASVALEAARRQGVPAFYRAVFLDDRENVPYTLGQLQRFRRIIEQQGVALAIGHPSATTIDALAKPRPLRGGFDARENWRDLQHRRPQRMGEPAHRRVDLLTPLTNSRPIWAAIRANSSRL